MGHVREVRPRACSRRSGLFGIRRLEGGATLLELLVVAMVVGVIMLSLGRFFHNIFTSYKETQMRLRMQRDMRTLSYWIKMDLTALAQRSNNFDLKNSGASMDYSFIAADDPKDTADASTNTSDNGLDRYTYTFSGNQVTRKWNPLGTMSSVERIIALECIEASAGDTYSVDITLHDLNDSVVVRSQFDATLENYDYANAIQSVEIELLFCKRPPGSSTRPAITERAQIRTVALYRKSSG